MGTPQETPKQKNIRRGIFVGILALFGGVHQGAEYIKNISEYPERTADMQKILTHFRDSRLVPYNVANTITHDDRHHVYIPKTIDGVAILLGEMPSTSYEVVMEKPLPHYDTLEARLKLPHMFASQLSEDGERLLIEEREIIKQIIGDAIKTAKQFGATAIKPEIILHTELTPNRRTGPPDYWDSKTDIVGKIIYYK